MVLKNTNANQPSYQVMSRDKTPFNVEELCESLENHVLPLLHNAKEIAGIIVRVVSTQPLPGITEDEMNTIENMYVQVYGVMDDEDNDEWAYFRQTCIRGRDGCKAIYELLGDMLHHRSSYSFVAGLLVYKLSVRIKAHNGGPLEPTRYLIREATHALWKACVELYSQDLSSSRHLIGHLYTGKEIPLSLLELLLEDQSDLGNIGVDKVKDTIKHGFPVVWRD